MKEDGETATEGDGRSRGGAETPDRARAERGMINGRSRTGHRLQTGGAEQYRKEMQNRVRCYLCHEFHEFADDVQQLEGPENSPKTSKNSDRSYRPTDPPRSNR